VESIYSFESEVQEDPDDAEYCDKHVEAIASTLPVASRTKRRHLQHDLNHRRRI